MNEAETRRRIIDEQLRLAGWKIDDPSQIVTELDLFLATKGNRSGDPHAGYDTHQFSDYGFMLKARPGMIMETKRTSKDAEAGQEQGLQYAQTSQSIFGGPIPFVMYSNGNDTFFWESDFYPPGKVYGFPTRDDLEWLAQRRDTRKRLSEENYSRRGHIRSVTYDDLLAQAKVVYENLLNRPVVLRAKDQKTI